MQTKLDETLNKSMDEGEQFQVSLFANRRNKLLQEVDPNSIIFLFSANVKHRNEDVDYNFRQESNFYYLTGWNEQEAIAVLIPGQDSTQNQFILFSQKKDPEKEVWTGQRIGQTKAKEIYGADVAYTIDEFEEKLPELLAKRQKIYYSESDGEGHQIHPTFEATLEECIGDHPKENVMPIIHEMRLLKDEYEVECIKKAIEITAKGHFRAMLLTNESMKREYEIEAEFVYPIVKNGARSVGYSNIVATGENCCTLHYVHNNAAIKKNSLTLMDAGAEFENYTADITRTFPINGKFSKEQRVIYELVLKAQEAGISKVFPGSNWTAVRDIVAKTLTEGLIKLGILEGQLLEGTAFEQKVDELLSKGAYKPFYTHGPGHWLGLDVHDSGSYKSNFESGMVMRMEPGIYIPFGSPGVDPRWYGIGVRIEDDLLVHSQGCTVLSDYLPRKVEEIEVIMAGNYKLTDNRLMDFQEYEKLVAEIRLQRSKKAITNAINGPTLFTIPSNSSTTVLSQNLEAITPQ